MQIVVEQGLGWGPWFCNCKILPGSVEEVVPKMFSRRARGDAKQAWGSSRDSCSSWWLHCSLCLLQYCFILGKYKVPVFPKGWVEGWAFPCVALWFLCNIIAVGSDPIVFFSSQIIELSYTLLIFLVLHILALSLSYPASIYLPSSCLYAHALSPSTSLPSLKILFGRLS